MADNAQAKWNAVKIVYGSRDPKISINGGKRYKGVHQMDPFFGKTHQTLYQTRPPRPTQAFLPPVSRRILNVGGREKIPHHQSLVGFV